MTVDLSLRHPSTREGIERLSFEHHRPGPAREAAAVFHRAGVELLALVDDCPDLTAALRDLWEGKNLAVYAAIQQQQKAAPCVCAAPTTEGTTHRQDGPCFVTGSDA